MRIVMVALTAVLAFASAGRAAPGLGDQAVKAAKAWQFLPGTRNGEPVPVLVSIEMTFTLGKN
jgi:outer membrane biosynthesis protein TonB